MMDFRLKALSLVLFFKVVRFFIMECLLLGYIYKVFSIYNIMRIGVDYFFFIKLK